MYNGNCYELFLRFFFHPGMEPASPVCISGIGSRFFTTGETWQTKINWTERQKACIIKTHRQLMSCVPFENIFHFKYQYMWVYHSLSLRKYNIALSFLLLFQKILWVIQSLDFDWKIYFSCLCVLYLWEKKNKDREILRTVKWAWLYHIFNF